VWLVTSRSARARKAPRLVIAAVAVWGSSCKPGAVPAGDHERPGAVAPPASAAEPRPAPAAPSGPRGLPITSDEEHGRRRYTWRGDGCEVSLTVEARDAQTMGLRRHATCALTAAMAAEVWTALLKAAAPAPLDGVAEVSLGWGRVATPAEDDLAAAGTEALARAAASSPEWDLRRGRSARRTPGDNALAARWLADAGWPAPVLAFFAGQGFRLASAHAEKVLVGSVSKEARLRSVRPALPAGGLPFDAAVELRFARPGPPSPAVGPAP
jgi:hypothetical protein